MGSLYRQDIWLWSREQSAVLRKAAEAGSNLPVDWENVAEEIEGVGNAERSSLRSHIGRVLEHLMKLQASPAREPRRGWADTIIDARREIEDILDSSPSLRREIGDLVAQQTPRVRKAVRLKLQVFGELPTTDIDSLSYTEEEVLSWLPEV